MDDADTGQLVERMKAAAMLQTQHHTLIPTTETTDADRRKRIRELNDTFRRQQTQAAFLLGEFFKTPRIHDMPWGDQWAIVEMVKRFEHFDERLDPNGQHDFGAFSYKGQRIFWKIDYYDPKFTKASDDPGDPERTVRILTIHLAEEQ